MTLHLVLSPPALHHNTSTEHQIITAKRIKFFWIAVAGMAIYEVIPAYM